MRRPPRRLTDRVIDAEMWVGIVWVGAVMAVVTLLAIDLRLPGGIVGGSGSVNEARTMAFTILVLAQLFNCFNARSDRRARSTGCSRTGGSTARSRSRRYSRCRRAAPVPERRLRHHATRARRVADVPRASKRRPLGRRSEKASRSAATEEAVKRGPARARLKLVRRSRDACAALHTGSVSVSDVAMLRGVHSAMTSSAKARKFASRIAHVFPQIPEGGCCRSRIARDLEPAGSAF